MSRRSDAIPERYVFQTHQDALSLNQNESDGGISIPSSYASFLAPIQSAKLYHEAGGSKDSREKDREKGLETPYVVMLQSFNFLAEDPPGPGHAGRCGNRIQQCWEFEHPRKDAVLDSNGGCMRVILLCIVFEFECCRVAVDE